MMRALGILWAFLLAYLFTAGPASAGPVFFAALSAGASFGAAIGATALGGFLTTFTGRLLTSVVFSALRGALAPKPKTPGITTENTATGGTNPLAFILGVSATAGDAVCPPMSHGKVGKTPNAYLTYVIALGDIPGQTLDRVAIDGSFVTYDPTADHADYGKGFAGKYRGYAWVKYYDGSQTAADPMLLAKYGSYPERPWLADMIGTGVPYVICTFRYSREVFSAFPAMLFECGGIKLYDPRKDSTIGGSGAHRWGQPATYAATRNNAVIAYNIARGITIPGLGVWGGSIDGADLPNASMFAAMNECDVTIGTPAVAQYRAGIEVRVDVEPASIVEELLKGCLGNLAEAGGEVKLRVGGPGLPVYFMTDDDIIVTKPQDFDPFPNSAARKNGIDAKYPDPETVWKTKSAPSRYNTTWEAEDGGRRVASLDLPACPFPDQVQRVMYAYIADERRFRKHGLTLPPDAAILEPLDVVSWTSTRNGYASKLFDLGEVTDDVRSLMQRVSAREVDTSDYSWSPTWALPVSVASSQPVEPPAQTLDVWAVAALSIPDANGTARRPAIRMTWSTADLDAVDAVQYQVKVKATGAVVKVGTVSEVVGGQIILAEGIVPNTLYQARGLPVTPGRAATWTDWVDVTSPDVRIDTVDLATPLATTISDTVTAAAAAQAELDQLTAGLVTDVNGALASIEARTRAGLDGWLTDPIFSRWTAGNLTSTYWLQRTGTSVYASKVAGLYGSAIFIDVPAGTTPVQFIARSDLETNGMKGADPDAPFVVVTLAVECISGVMTNPTLRPEWSPDNVTWTRGELQGIPLAVGSFSQLGISIKPGVVQTVEALWKRPAGSSSYVRLIGYPKSTANTVATQQVWHLMQIRSASEAERNAWNVPAMQATIDTHETAISGPTGAIATLTTNLSATNTTAVNAASAAAAAATLAGSKGKVIFGSATPVAGDQQAENLWIDTTGGINAPKRWLGGAWVIARDKVAVDAAAAAAAAQSTADAVAANLSTNYLTATTTSSAIAAVKQELIASLQPYQAQKLHADFRFGDYYWAANYTQSVASLPSAAYPTAYTEVTLETVAGIGAVLQKGAGSTNRNISERTHRPFVVGQKMRFRMKTRLTANPTTGSHSTRLYFAMTDSAGAYLGITGIIANFLATVVADGWVIKEFVFDPQAIKAAGAHAATAVNWRMMVQLDGLNSAVQQVEWIELEDVTTDTSLQAAITSIQAVDISALTGTALATLLTQLGVAAGGTSAWVTSQTSAVATLNGYAAASYSLRIGAGGASAGFEIVASDNPVLGPTSALVMSAKHIEIQASSLRISDSSNVYPDFDMADPLFYSTSNTAAYSFLATGVSKLGKKFLSINANAAAKSVETGWFAVEPSTEYLVSGAAWMTATGAGGGTSTLTIETGSVDAAGAVTGLTSSVVVARTDIAYGGAQHATIDLTTGINARVARFKLTRAAGGTGAGRGGGLKVQKKASGILIQNGAISGLTHIETGSLNADDIQAGIMNARRLEVTELLKITNGTGAISVGKDSAFDLDHDGAYFGRTLGAGGTYGFGFAAGKKIGGVDQYIQATDQTGLKLVNAAHFVTGAAAAAQVGITTSQTVTLPVGTALLALNIMAGGKGGSGSTDQSGAGVNGGNTVVQLWNGAVNTGISWTANGATYTSSGRNGVSSPLGGGGAGGGNVSFGSTPSGGNASGYGAGGGGGGSRSASSDNGGNASGGIGGGAGEYVQIASIDLSAYANPKLVITIGAGGAGGGNGGNGSQGIVQYTAQALSMVPASVLPLAPTFTGSVSKPANGKMTFPNYGAGLWVLSSNGASLLLGSLQTHASGKQVRAHENSSVTFVSDITPIDLANDATAVTVDYQFFKLGTWV